MGLARITLGTKMRDGGRKGPEIGTVVGYDPENEWWVVRRLDGTDSYVVANFGYPGHIPE